LVQDALYNNVAGPFQTATLSNNQTQFTISVPSGAYSIFAFVDFDGSRTLNLAQAPPLGWYATQQAGWFAPIDVRNTAQFTNANIELKASHPFTSKQFNSNARTL